MHTSERCVLFTPHVGRRTRRIGSRSMRVVKRDFGWDVTMQ
jgi:hypothetical protein